MNTSFLFHSLEWAAALLMICGVWLMTSRGRYALLGLLLFLVAVAAGVWTSWKTAHAGAVAQMAVLAIIGLQGLLKGRGRSLLKIGK